MLHAQRQAEMTWEGNLAQGKGKINLGSGAVEELPMTWAARAEQPGGKTSPEELIAAAFERAARQAEQLCPVSNALCNNVAIHLNAHLE